MLQLSKFILFVLREKWKGGGDGIEKKNGNSKKNGEGCSNRFILKFDFGPLPNVKKKKTKNASDKIFSGLALPNFPEQSFQSI